MVKEKAMSFFSGLGRVVWQTQWKCFTFDLFPKCFLGSQCCCRCFLGLNHAPYCLKSFLNLTNVASFYFLCLWYVIKQLLKKKRTNIQMLKNPLFFADSSHSGKVTKRDYIGKSCLLGRLVSAFMVWTLSGYSSLKPRGQQLTKTGEKEN